MMGLFGFGHNARTDQTFDILKWGNMWKCNEQRNCQPQEKSI